MNNSPLEEYKIAVIHSSENYFLLKGGAVRNVTQPGKTQHKIQPKP